MSRALRPASQTASANICHGLGLIDKPEDPHEEDLQASGSSLQTTPRVPGVLLEAAPQEAAPQEAAPQASAVSQLSSTHSGIRLECREA